MIIQELAEGVLAGKPRAVARAISMAERGGEDAEGLLALLRPSARSGRIVGITGSPGAGKSSLIGRLAREYRDRRRRVGVLAIDPSSPVTGGAVLGDRVRMAEVATDSGVFVRSMASRGRSGGLAPAVEDAATILRAASYDVVLLETVGVGQGEVDVASIVDTVVVVLTPGMGDEVQSLKAGLLEVADIYVVNKSDLVGADAVARSLHVVAAHSPDGWMTPIIKTSAVSSEGITTLANAVEDHGKYLATRHVPDKQEIQLISKTILSLASRHIIDALESKLDGRLERLAAEVAAGDLEPAEAAREAVRLFFATHRSVDSRDVGPRAVAALAVRNHTS